jgi:hypothetical protein
MAVAALLLTRRCAGIQAPLHFIDEFQDNNRLEGRCT